MEEEVVEDVAVVVEEGAVVVEEGDEEEIRLARAIK
eukprot:CAMPEP_0170801974 /NCGR_PEP_ID=MMETSP0733-20121128/28924_1 /TAXON_ID=186038 /ORGANISM="Fragilariopsis kerguelensis, Strain L26-C5" /LENGTH=35 /DNA_ID= /DNA_START= /DNA_END= /DNA_ORIENTATION=